MPDHPMQPIVWVDGVIRFKRNQIVRDLLDFTTPRGFGMNEIVPRGYSRHDYEQFIQLIGYSVSGAGDLFGFSRKKLERADGVAEQMYLKRHAPKKKKKGRR